MPIPVIVLTVMAIVAWLVFSYTRFGRYVYAVGGNREGPAPPASMSNSSPLRSMSSAASALIRSLLYTSRLMAAQRLWHGLPLEAIAAAVVRRRLAFWRPGQD